MFYSHLWMGVLVTALTLILAATGILLNHKTSLGLMPDVANTASGTLDEALSMADLVRRAEAEVPPEVSKGGVDRLDVRPDKGLMKVRFGDLRVTEVTVDIHSGDLLFVGERNDVFLEKLHTGEIFGDSWILLSDFAALALALLVATGLWLWLYPKSRV